MEKTKIKGFPKLIVNQYNELEFYPAYYILSLEGTGIVVQADTVEEGIKELVKSIEALLNYQLRFETKIQ